MSQIQSGILNQVALSGLDANDRAWQATTGMAIAREQERAAHSWSADGFWTTMGKAGLENMTIGLGYDAGPRSGNSAIMNFYSDLGIQQSFAEPMDEMHRRDAQQRLIVNRDDIGMGMTANLVQSARNAFNSEGKGRSEAMVAIYGTDDQGELFDEDTLGKMFNAGSEYELANLRGRALREREVAVRRQSMSAPVNFAVSFAAGFVDPASLLSGMGAGAVGSRIGGALLTTEIAPGIVLPGTANVFKSLATRGIIAGGENVAQGVVLADLAGQDYNWHDAMRDMAFGSTFSTVFGTLGPDGAISQAAEIRTQARRFKELSSVLSALEHGAELTDRGALFFQHVPGLTRTSTMLDIAAAEMVRVQAFDHVEAADGGKSDFGWLVGRKATFDGIGEVTVTGIDGRDVIGTIDGREVRMGVNGVAVDRFAQLQPGTRVRLDDGTLGTIDTALTESTPFSEDKQQPSTSDTSPAHLASDLAEAEMSPQARAAKAVSDNKLDPKHVDGFDKDGQPRVKKGTSSAKTIPTARTVLKTALSMGRRVNAALLDGYNATHPERAVELPDGYVREGDFYVSIETGRATRPPKRGDATTTVRVRGDDGKIHNLKPEELLARGGVAAVRRGQVVFDPAQAGRAVIAFGKARNASTLAHETGHVFRRTLRDIDGELAAKIDEHYGQSGQNWTVDAEERFARDFEQYMKEGKAPTKELATTFERFAAWLSDLWQSIGGKKADLTDVQREAFGRLLDSDQSKGINGELGGRYAATRDSLRRVLGRTKGAKAVDALMLANAKAWSRATGRNIDEYFEQVIAGFTDSLRNPFHAPIRQLPPRTIIVGLEPPTSKGELGTTMPDAPAPVSEASPLIDAPDPVQVPTPDTALVGREAKLVLGSGRVLAVKYAIIDADRLIPSNDARKGFAKNEAGDLNERPYHDPTEGKASREKVYAIADNPDTSQIINDAPTSNVGPPIVGPNGVVYGGNARSMGIQVAYSRGGPGASAIRTATLAAAERFGVERATADGIKNPVLVRMVSAADAGKPGELSRALNEDVATGRTADADAVSRGRLVKPDTASSISTIIGDRSIDEALRDPKSAMQIMKALRDDNAVSDKDISMFVQGDTLNTEGKLTIKRTLLGVVIPDVRTLAETPPSIENVFIRALGPLVRLLQDTRGKASDFRLTIDDTLRALADYRRGDFETFNQMLMEPAGFTPEPWRDNPTAVAFARIISENKPTEVYRILNSMAEEAAEAKSGQFMLGAEKPPEIEEIIGKHLGVEVLAQDKPNGPGTLAQDVLDLTDTIKSEDRNNALPLGGAKGSGQTGGKGVRVSAAPRIDRVGILKGMDHPLTNVITNAVFQDPMLDSQDQRGNASAEQFQSLKMHAVVDGHLRQMHEHITKAATAAGIGRINIPKRMKFEMEFREQVGKAIRDPNFNTTDPNLKAAVELHRKTTAAIGQIGKDNFVKNFDKFALDDNYLTRVWDFKKLHELTKTHTPQEVANLFEEAVHNQRPSLTRAEARILGDSLQKKLFTYGGEAGIEGAGFAAGLNSREYLLNTLKANGVDEATSLAIADKVAIDKDNTGTLSVAKRRTLLNEKASIVTAKGERISIEDLLNNDSMAIIHRYGQQVIAEAAMTQVRRQVGAKIGLKWESDSAMLEYMAGDMHRSGYSKPEINKAIYLIDSGIKRMRGIALDDSGVWSDNAWRVRQFASIVGNGGFGIPAAFELGHAITRLGVRASFANMPAVLAAHRAMRKGEVNDPALKALLYTIGIGHDTVSARYFGSWEHGTDPFQTNPQGRLAAADKVLGGIARASRFASGVPHITEFSRLLAANGVQHKLVQQALSGKAPSARRLAWLGMDQTRWDNVSKMIQANHKKGPGGLVDVQLDGGGWTDAQAKHDYIEAVRSQVNTIIQEGGIGASHPWLETEVGKLIFQFRQFGIMAYNRQTLAQYQIGDSEAIGRGMLAAVPIGMMQYMATTYLNSIGREDRDEYLAKMTTPDRMAIAAFSRASFSSIGPTIYDSFATAAGYETLGGFRASGLESDPLLGNPTFSIITAGRKGLGGGIRSMIDPNYDLSDDNIRGIRTVVPFSRLPGTSIMWNQILNQTPAKSLNKVDEP